jgi:hypothetical protein
MRMAIEHAGAERGLLILLGDDDLRIQAEATTGTGSIAVALRNARVSSTDLPESVSSLLRGPGRSSCSTMRRAGARSPPTSTSVESTPVELLEDPPLVAARDHAPARGRRLYPAVRSIEVK